MRPLQPPQSENREFFNSIDSGKLKSFSVLYFVTMFFNLTEVKRDIINNPFVCYLGIVFIIPDYKNNVNIFIKIKSIKIEK